MVQRFYPELRLHFHAFVIVLSFLGFQQLVLAQPTNQYSLPVLSKAQQAVGLVSNVSSSTGKSYTLVNLAVGAMVYTDRAYEVTSVPAPLVGAALIQTANDDKRDTSADMLSFTLTTKATVIVAYDPRGKKFPSWLSGWQKLPNKLGVNDSKISQVDLYSKAFPAGKVSLGGNMAAPALGAQNNYFVIVSEVTPESIINNLLVPQNRAYFLSELFVGVTPYTDRTYEVTSVPAHLKGMPFIKVPNDDKKNSSANMISFELTKPATLYIAYDPRAMALPAWLQGWKREPDQLGVNDSKITYMNLYSKEFPAGKVQLGGNMSMPAEGAMCNYFVVIKAADIEEEKTVKRRSMQLYPNPNAGANMHVDLRDFGSGEKVTLMLYDLLGEPVHTADILTSETGQATTEFVFDKKMRTGVYLLRVKSTDGYLQKKLIVN